MSLPKPYIAPVLCGLCAFALGLAGELTLAPVPGGVSATLPDGVLHWQVTFPDQATPAIFARTEAGTLLSNGVVLGPQGELRARMLPSALSSPPLTAAVDPPAAPRRAAAWDTPVLIFPPGHDSFMQYFDSDGNAYALIANQAASALQLRRSVGHTSVWNAVENIPVGVSDIFGPTGVIDEAGHITIIFRSGYYGLRCVRYTPDSGWSTAQQFYSTTSFFQCVRAGVDAAGNVVVVFDEHTGWNAAARSLVYDAASGTWGPVQTVSPPGYSILLPNIIYNASADTMYLVYLAQVDSRSGVCAHRWDSLTRTWGPVEQLPDSDGAWFSGAGSDSRLPGVVDGTGAATVFWGDHSDCPHASHGENGAWQPAVACLAMPAVGLEDFAAATAGAGDAVGIMNCWDGALNHLFIFRHRAGTGWLPPENPLTTPFNKISRTRLAFYQGRRAVATVIDYAAGREQLVSLCYDGAGWVPGLVDIPGPDSAYFSDLVPDRGEVLLVFEGSRDEISQGVKATFLHDPHPGDVNCDLAANALDINPFVRAMLDPVAYQAAFPDCLLLNADVTADGVVNALDINPFVQLLTADR